MLSTARPFFRPILHPQRLSAAWAFALAGLCFAAQAQPTMAPRFDEPGDPPPALPQETRAETKARRQFEMLDSNHDGRLSRKELAAFPQLLVAFDKADGNRDRLVSFEEIKAFFLAHRSTLERLKR